MMLLNHILRFRDHNAPLNYIKMAAGENMADLLFFINLPYILYIEGSVVVISNNHYIIIVYNIIKLLYSSYIFFRYSW